MSGLMWSRRVLLASALAAVAPSAMAQQKEVRLGLLLPVTGRYAELGISAQHGAQLVVDDLNANGGIKSLGGAKIKLFLGDNGSETAKTAIEARRLIGEDKVSFILGPYSTPEAETFMPVADRYEVGGVGLQTTLTPKTPYFSMLSITAAGFGKGYADAVKWLKRKGAKIDTVAITYANNDYGQTVSKSAAELLAKDGVKVLEAIPVDPAVKDMTPIVLKVKSLNPDAVISVVYFQDGVLLHRARFNLNYDAPIWLGGSAGFSDDKLWSVLGNEVAEKTLTRSYGLAFFSADADLPGLKAIVQRAHDVAPDRLVDQGFMSGAQAAIFAAKALEAAGSTDPKAVNEAFRKLKFPAKSPEIVLPFIAGDFSFDENGVTQGATPLFVQWKDGKKAIVFPEAIATAQPLLK